MKYVHNEALCYVRPVLPRDFRYRNRQGDRYWCEWARWERHTRSRLGWLVPYQLTVVDSFWSRQRRGRFVAVHPQFARVEVPRGFYAELPNVLSYAGSRLASSTRAPEWAVFFTEYAVKVAVHFLWTLYERY